MKLLFQLFIFLLPTQIGKHFWPEWSHVYGIRTDYLSPTIYLTDILVLLMLVVWTLRTKAKIRLPFLKISLLIAFLAANIFFAQNPEAALIKWVKVAELAFIVLLVAKEKKLEIKSWVLKPLFLSLLTFSFIAFGQFILQRTIGGFFYWLGERSFTLATPGIAKFNFLGQWYMRPYSTFPHPNVMAGFFAVGLVLLLGKKYFHWSLLFVLLAIVLSVSHGVWVSLIIVGLFYFLTRRRKELFKRLYILIITLTIAVSLILPIVSDNLLGTLEYSEEVHRRLSLAKVSGLMMAARPFVGVGMNNFIVELANSKNAPLVSWWFQPVHNIFLLVFSEVGILGFGLFLIFLSTVVRKGLSREDRTLALAFLLIILTGFMDHYWLTLQQTQLLGSVVLGLLFRAKLMNMGEKALQLYCDGGARGNPGPAASAFVAVIDGRVLHKESKYLGKATNNIAEYKAMILGLSWLAKKGLAYQSAIINLDSELVAKQMSGSYKVKSAKLKELFAKAKKLESQLSLEISYKWSPRSKNRLADFLVNEELDRNDQKISRPKIVFD